MKPTNKKLKESMWKMTQSNIKMDKINILNKVGLLTSDDESVQFWVMVKTY